jgi:hypothetical protein
METIKISEEETILELIDGDGSFINGDYNATDSLTVTNKPNRNGVAPPTSKTFGDQAAQDPSARMHYSGFSSMGESKLKEDVVQTKSSHENSLVNKDAEVLSLKDINELFNERYLTSEISKVIKDINELWSKYDERERDLNQIKMSLLYHILNDTNAKEMPNQYRKTLRKVT